MLSWTARTGRRQHHSRRVSRTSLMELGNNTAGARLTGAGQERRATTGQPGDQDHDHPKADPCRMRLHPDGHDRAPRSRRRSPSLQHDASVHETLRDPRNLRWQGPRAVPSTRMDSRASRVALGSPRSYPSRHSSLRGDTSRGSRRTPLCCTFSLSPRRSLDQIAAVEEAQRCGRLVS